MPGEEDLESPIGYADMFILAVFFLLRGVEASLMLMTSVVLDTVELTVTLFLPASKADPKALGCSSTWGCICSAVVDDFLCPYHAAVRRGTE